METAKANLTVLGSGIGSGGEGGGTTETDGKARRRRSIARAQAVLARPLLAEDPRLRERDRGRVPRSQLAGEEHRSRTSTKLLEALEGSSPEFIEDADARLQARADERARVSPYLLSLIDWSDPVRRSAAHPVHPGRVAPPARSPEARPRLAARAGRRAGRRASRTATPTRRSFSRSTPARSTAASARAATPSASTPRRSRRSTSRSNDERWQRAFEYIASRPELEDIVISGGDAYQLRAAADRPRSARRCSRCRTSAACASRPRARRSCRRRSSPTTRGSTRSRASSRRAASCTRRSCSTRTSTTRTRSPASPRTR